MPTSEIKETRTLRDLREGKGLSHSDVVAGIAAYFEEEPKHWTASVQYERRGVRNIDIIEALAQVYGVTVETARAAARNSRTYGMPPDARRRSRQVVSVQ